MPDDDTVELTRNLLVGFCREFIDHPYLCYTEHGLHTRFASVLYRAISEDQRYLTLNGLRICRVQKEYPTHKDLSKSRRQHWDVSVLKSTVDQQRVPGWYDHLPLAAVVEFGLNCDLEHLEDDVRRLSHSDSQVGQGFCAHLFRLSDTKSRPSARDWSTRSRRIHAAEAIRPLLANTGIEVYLGVVDESRSAATGFWRITENEVIHFDGGGTQIEAPLIPTTE